MLSQMCYSDYDVQHLVFHTSKLVIIVKLKYFYSKTMVCLFGQDQSYHLAAWLWHFSTLVKLGDQSKWHFH